MKKTFDQVAVGSQFTHNGVEYKKTDVVKVSCCKSINAIATTNEKDRIYVQPTQEVEVSE